MNTLYWQAAKRINKVFLQVERTDYGQKILATLSQQLSQEYRKRFNYSTLTWMVKLAEVLPDDQIVVTLLRQSSWSHFFR